MVEGFPSGDLLGISVRSDARMTGVSLPAGSLRRVDSKSVVAYASIFNVVDLQGDRVLAGAFANSIRRWKSSGDSPAFCWSHDWADPFALLGKITDMREDGRGLLITAQVDEDTDFSRQVMKLLRNRIVTQFSFSYDVVHERKAEDGANELIELELIEAGPCLRGANNQTELISAKALMKAAHQGGTVIMDASNLERAYDPRATAWWHVEERGLDYCVISDADGSEVGRFRTRGEAVARLVELEANNVAARGDPAYWRRAIEEAAAGREFSPERLAAEQRAAVDRAAELKRRDPAVAKQVDDLILATRQELAQEAKQAEWEEWMRVNTVLNPIRVDPRMRPIVEDNPTESDR